MPLLEKLKIERETQAARADCLTWFEFTDKGGAPIGGVIMHGRLNTTEACRRIRGIRLPLAATEAGMQGRALTQHYTPEQWGPDFSRAWHSSGRFILFAELKRMFGTVGAAAHG